MKSLAIGDVEPRIWGVDLFRVLAVFAVICIHSRPFDGINTPLAVFVNQSARFAVPFFFVTSGFFFGRKLRDGHPVGALFLQYSRRLLTAFGVWSLVYLLYPRDFLKAAVLDRAVGWDWLDALTLDVYRNCQWIAEHPGRFMLSGSAPHLWFIVSLGTSIGILSILAALGLQRSILYIAVPLYVLALLGGSYSTTPFGLRLPFDVEHSPFVSTLYVGLGCLLAQSRVKVSLSWAVAIAACGLALHLAEGLVIFLVYGTPMAYHEALLGTVPYGLGVVLTALAMPHVGRRWVRLLGGKYMLGVYTSHVLIMDVVRPVMFVLPALVWTVVSPVLTYAIAVCLTACLARVPGLRRGVV